MFKLYLNRFSMLLAITTALNWQTVLSVATLDVISSPDSLRFCKSESIKMSSLSDVLSLALGYSLPEPLEWKGLTAITDAFSLAKASVSLTINGDLNLQSLYKYPIVETQSFDDVFDVLSERTQQKFSDNNRIVLKINSYQKDQYLNHMSGKQLSIPGFSDSIEERVTKALQTNDLKNFIQNNKLDINDPNIKGLVLEIAAIRQTLESLKHLKDSDNKFKSIRSVIWFDIKYFGHIFDGNDYDNSVKNSAQKLINNLVEEMKHDLRDIYGNGVIFTVIEGQLSAALVRKIRQISDSGLNQNNATLNLAHDFDPNFHTAFAMIGFTTLLIALSVFGVSVSMWNLDPGKDSIIYRMTSQRIKKDQ